MFKKSSVLSMDIGSHSLKTVVVEGSIKKPVLTKCSITPLPSHAIVDGELMDRETVIDAIRQELGKLEIDNKQVISCISGRDIIVKKIKMPKMNEVEAREQIKWEAEQYIPYDIEDISMDFEIVNPNAGEDSMEVILVGAKKSSVEARINLFREVGLEPIVLDIPAFSLQNIFEFNYTTKPNKLVGLLDIGAQSTTMSFVTGSINHFTRSISTAVNNLIQALQREAGIDGERATDIIRSGKKEEIDQYAYQNAMESFQDDLGVAIERVLPYLPEGFESFSEIIISGGGSLIPGLPKFLEERFGCHTEVINPFINFEYDKESSFIKVNLEKEAPVLAIALGLALRGL
ncbi:MAG: type IV pilus assembly protein PilM [candidate division WOR-3 bacterium]